MEREADFPRHFSPLGWRSWWMWLVPVRGTQAMSTTMRDRAVSCLKMLVCSQASVFRCGPAVILPHPAPGQTLLLGSLLVVRVRVPSVARQPLPHPPGERKAARRDPVVPADLVLLP